MPSFLSHSLLVPFHFDFLKLYFPITLCKEEEEHVSHHASLPVVVPGLVSITLLSEEGLQLLLLLLGDS